jgi:Fe-Mn family superoxide dismutase
MSLSRWAGHDPIRKSRSRSSARRKIERCGPKALGGGSGWVLLTWSPRDRRLVNQWAADHTTTLAGGRPIVALDMYEHSYHIDFGAKAATYVDTFMQAIRWAIADRLYGLVQTQT